MKIKLLLLITMMGTTMLWSQSRVFWQKQTSNPSKVLKESHQTLKEFQTFSLNTQALRQALNGVAQRNQFSVTSNTILSFPNSEGKMERFSIKEASVMHPDLQERFPDIRSYVGQGIDDASSILRFSISPEGFNGMILSAKGNTFIEPLEKNSDTYIAFNRENRINYNDDFECEVNERMNRRVASDFTMKNADDSILRTYRLAVSTTGEYTQYHGGTVAQALAAINTTMTRVNGIFEVDFNVTMILIPNNDTIIYTNANTDPYSNGNFNNQLQSTLTSVIGESNYDVGHLFARASNNGNAGCIGCVCINGQKGSAFTSRTTPEGDPFDVDYVAHELGHQFGANHTWTFGGNEGTNAQMEPGSGSTIMGYAGITGATDVQPNSDPYFHAVSIEQVTNYIKSTSCQTNTNTGNSVPVVNAGSNYTIPRGTPFVLEGSASDANSGDVLTYCWEQYDENNASSTYPSTTATTGVAFRSYEPTTNSNRYFPRLETIKTGATSWQWEAVPNVARTLNFRLTVRDNVAGGGANNSDDMVVTVNSTAGPFVVNSPNTNVTWNAGTTQTVTWNVAGTTGNGVNAANVDIFLSTDGGDTYPITLATGVTNDGSHDIVVPNNQGNQNRIMVRGSNHIFFDISNSNFTIAGQVVCNATVPTGLVASNIGSNTATLSWDAVPGASYDLQYRQVGASTWTTLNVNGISTNLTGLSPLTQYEAQVRSECPDTSTSAFSSIINFTTTDVQLNYCSSASTNVNDEFISRVQLNTIDNTSGAQFYSDFTGISTTLTKDTQYTITVTPTWTGTVYSEGYSVWIDYNRDGDFNDVGEQVWTQAATTATPVSGSFTIPSNAVENSTRMRVSMKYNGIPTECETFTYGEVEDYTVIIEGNGPDTEAPVITLNGASTIDLELGDTYTELGATATDNVDGNLTSSIVVGGDTVNTSIVGSYVVTYNVSDAAGNAATEVIRTVNVNPDTTAPVITLIGSNPVNLNVGDTYNELGATATDNLDGDIRASIVITGSVNTAVAGTYFVNYNVSDSSGNAAAQVTRTINVQADTTPPVIVLVGAANINLTVGDSYIEQGATATDNLDGDITANIVIAGSVNSGLAGTYLVTYNVSDAAGNAATEVVRTVNVSDPSLGCTAEISTYPYIEGFEGSIGAWSQSTADDLNWDVNSGTTPSSGTGPTTATQGSNYIYVEASGNNVGYPNKRAIITSPCFDLSGLTNPIFSFSYHMFGAIDMGSIDLELSDDDGNTWTSLWNQTGNQGDQWLKVDIDLSTYAGSNIQLRFNRFVGSTWQADIAIDDVQLLEPAAPTCNDGIQNGDETGVDCGGSSCAPCSTSNVILNEGYFETGWDNWVDGGSDCARVSSANSYEGNFSIQIRDNSGVASSMTLNNIDVTPYSSVEIDFYFYVLSMENGEDFWVRYFDGSSWNTVATYVSGTNINNNTFYNATVTVTPAQYNFAVNSGFRFQNDASGNNDQIFIDQVIITGISSGSRGKGDNIEVVGYLESPELSEADINLYPNPVKGSILNVEVSNLEVFKYKIVNIQGRTVLSGTSEGKIDVSKLDGGMYIIEVNDGDEIIAKKFIKN
ncbi:immunoglobulin-like domain-containing protein [Winogradskyella sp. HB-48]|uniref:immunoglobulin-like domain-containing protein n=1 Tax=Winogradskyella sp. HB-48 TaxID=3416808 RepID=UPI003CF3123B